MTPDEAERLIAAFRREDAYIEHLAEELYLTKVRTYEDTLSGLAAEYGYDNEDVSISIEVAQALSDEADAHAESIAETYNTRMEARVRAMAAMGMTYEQAVENLSRWSNERDEARAELIAVSETYPAHADAVLSFFTANGIPVQFDFGGHEHGDAPAVCPICMWLEERSPHPVDRVLRVGTPHPQCRQNWHPRVDERDLPDEVELGIGTVAGIVGQDSLVTRAGGTQQAVDLLGSFDG